MTEPSTKPATVSHEDGEVLIDGPDGVVSSWTPEAALESASRLERAAMDALLERTGAPPSELEQDASRNLRG